MYECLILLEYIFEFFRIEFYIESSKSVADLRWRGREGRPSHGQNSFNFMQFLGKFAKIMCWRPLENWRSQLREILGPPMKVTKNSFFYKICSSLYFNDTLSYHKAQSPDSDSDYICLTSRFVHPVRTRYVQRKLLLMFRDRVNLNLIVQQITRNGLTRI